MNKKSVSSYGMVIQKVGVFITGAGASNIWNTGDCSLPPLPHSLSSFSEASQRVDPFFIWPYLATHSLEQIPSLIITTFFPFLSFPSLPFPLFLLPSSNYAITQISSSPSSIHQQGAPKVRTEMSFTSAMSFFRDIQIQQIH